MIDKADDRLGGWIQTFSGHAVLAHGSASG